jgi:hypothetical protein
LDVVGVVGRKIRGENEAVREDDERVEERVEKGRESVEERTWLD